MSLELLIQQNALAIKQLKDDAKKISDLAPYAPDLASDDLLIFSIDSSGQSVSVTFAKLLSQMQSVQSSVNITKQMILDSLGYIPEDASLKGTSSGYAPIVIGKIPTQFLPSYIDEIIEGTYINATTFNDTAGTPVVGGAAKIYQDTSTGNTTSGLQYRWSGSQFTEIQKSAGTSDTVVEGVNNLYFTNSRVLNTLITGLNLANTDSITAADTVLSALGKLQAQLVFNYNSSEDKLPKGTYVGTADDILIYIDQQITNLDSAKVDKVIGKSLVDDTEIMRLADLQNNFKGKFTTTTQFPLSGVPGNYVQLDEGAAFPLKNYNWDVEDGWVAGSTAGTGATNTDELIEGSSNLYFTAARALAAAGFKVNLEASNTKAPPIDADIFGYLNSAASNVLVKFTWANIKATLKTYFDTLYAPKYGTRAVLAAAQIDWADGVDVHTKTITAALALTEINLPQGSNVFIKKLIIAGAFSVTMPGAHYVWKGGVAGGVSDAYVFDCINGNAGSLRVEYTITPNA